MAQVGRKKGGKNQSKVGGQLLLDLFPKKMGRPAKSPDDKKINPSKGTSGLRFKEYLNVESSKGGLISGISDQYGRIMVHFVNEKNEWDIKPSGHSISARH